jgi:prevent-host-death family protein
MQMNIAEAKAKLSELIAAVERGEDVVIARGGVPVARIVPASHGTGFRIGLADGAVARCPDFLEPVADEDARLWE